MDSHHFQVLHDTQELYDCRRLNQSIITSEVTYSIAAVATFWGRSPGSATPAQRSYLRSS